MSSNMSPPALIVPSRSTCGMGKCPAGACVRTCVRACVRACVRVARARGLKAPRPAVRREVGWGLRGVTEGQGLVSEMMKGGVSPCRPWSTSQRTPSLAHPSGSAPHCARRTLGLAPRSDHLSSPSALSPLHWPRRVQRTASILPPVPRFGRSAQGHESGVWPFTHQRIWHWHRPVQRCSHFVVVGAPSRRKPTFSRREGDKRANELAQTK